MKELDDTGLLPNVRTNYPLADLIVAPPAAASKFLTQDLDVLIVNWDAANGDPEFGSHLAQRWLGHRRSELLMWVRDGGLLVIEGQAVFSVPAQPAYDALVGSDELPVCGAEDPLNPMKQALRMGARCRKTGHMPKEKGFEQIPEVLTVGGNPTHEQLFPGASAKLLTAHISTTNWQAVLYRGWFRRTVASARTLPWMPIVETADRRRGRNHATIVVARVGEGAIFASTLFLATTKQHDLVRAILKCSRSTEHLPQPAALGERMRKGVKYVLPALAGLALGYLTGLAGQLLTLLGVPHVTGDMLSEGVKLLFVPLGMLVFEVILRLIRFARTTVRDFIGY